MRVTNRVIMERAPKPLAAALVIALGVSACGGSETGAGSTTPDTLPAVTTTLITSETTAPNTTDTSLVTPSTEVVTETTEVDPLCDFTKQDVGSAVIDAATTDTLAPTEVTIEFLQDSLHDYWAEIMPEELLLSEINLAVEDIDCSFGLPFYMGVDVDGKVKVRINEEAVPQSPELYITSFNHEQWHPFFGYISDLYLADYKNGNTDSALIRDYERIAEIYTETWGFNTEVQDRIDDFFSGRSTEKDLTKITQPYLETDEFGYYEDPRDTPFDLIYSEHSYNQWRGGNSSRSFDEFFASAGNVSQFYLEDVIERLESGALDEQAAANAREAFSIMLRLPTYTPEGKSYDYYSNFSPDTLAYFGIEVSSDST